MALFAVGVGYFRSIKVLTSSIRTGEVQRQLADRLNGRILPPPVLNAGRTQRWNTVRPLDLLRVHHERIEAWILEQAAVQFVVGVEAGKLRVVAG